MTSLNRTSVLPSSTSPQHSASSSYGPFLDILGSYNNSRYGSNYYPGGSAYSDGPANLTYTVQDVLSIGNNPLAGIGEDGNMHCSGSFQLTPDGCAYPYRDNTGNVTSYNCARACTNPEQLFNDTATMANCMAYPAISAILAVCNTTQDFNTTAKAYGISSNQTEADNVVSTMQTCFRSFCQASETCAQYNISSHGSASSPYYGNQSLYYDGRTICDVVVAPVLTDIAGIGIYISYLLQSGIALTAFALLKLFDFWIYYIVLVALIWPRGLERANSAAHNVRKTARERALPRLAAALVEFHKSQCYFMLAVQIAAMVTVSRGQLEPINLQQLYNNWEVVHVVSISGFLPVTLVILSLHSVGKKSWYLTTLSIVTVGVSIGTLFMTGSFSPTLKDMSYLARRSSTIESCGYYDPSVYCLERYVEESALGTESATDILIFCIFMLVFIVIDLLSMLELGLGHRIMPILKRYKVYQMATEYWAGAQLVSRRSLHVAQRYLTAQRDSYLTAQKDSFGVHGPRWVGQPPKFVAASFVVVRNEWLTILIYLIYTIVWSFFIFFFSELLSYYAIFLSGGSISSVWNFGQIVGITVWAEPFVEYLYLEMKGMTAANYRFLPPWALVNMQTMKQKTDDANPEEIKLATISPGRAHARTESLASMSTAYKDSFEYEATDIRGDDEQYADTMSQGLVSKR